MIITLLDFLYDNKSTVPLYLSTLQIQDNIYALCICASRFVQVHTYTYLSTAFYSNSVRPNSNMFVSCNHTLLRKCHRPYISVVFFYWGSSSYTSLCPILKPEWFITHGLKRLWFKKSSTAKYSKDGKTFLSRCHFQRQFIS